MSKASFEQYTVDYISGVMSLRTPQKESLLRLEKINGSIPIVAEAIAKRDSEFIKARAKLQADSGATYIDCCASVPEAEEVETLKWMIDCIQEVTDLPISIDSPSPDVLAQAYKFCKKPGIFNSVSGEGHKIDTIFPIMAEPGNEGWQVIAY